MPTTYTDQFYTFDPAAPPPAGTAVAPVTISFTDQNDDGDIDRFDNDSVGGSDVTRSWPGDIVTINVAGVGNVSYTGTTFYLANGDRVFTPTDGQVLQPGTFVTATFVTAQGPLDVEDLGPPCFTPGTRIATPDGTKKIEALSPGDLVLTLDHGAEPVRWIGRRAVPGTGRFAPIRIPAGAFGVQRALVVSPQHRMLISGWSVELALGQSEILVPAKHLVGSHGVVVAPCPSVTYLHLLFDRHEIVFAEGAPSESFDIGGRYAAEDRETAAELGALFPDLPRRSFESATARPVARRFEAMALREAA
ncbi:MAG: Hint domain-containing protein [Pseudomonadota bacterium]